ncbi:MAG: hypothetical protein KGL74_03470, partial [Elusimicrobia bacterium]|nr:hypothetical protein [Elusimicrobiota bacterium]
MKALWRLLAALTLAASPSLGAVVAGVPALPASAVTAAFGAAVGARVLQTAGALSLRSPALALGSVEQLRAAIPAITDPQRRAAAVAVLGALTLP